MDRERRFEKWSLSKKYCSESMIKDSEMIPDKNFEQYVKYEEKVLLKKPISSAKGYRNKINHLLIYDEMIE